MCGVCVERFGWWRGYRSDFCGKTLEAVHKYKKLQDRRTDGQGWTHQWHWNSLWDNTFKKRKNLLCYSSWERGVRRCWMNNPEDIKVNQEGSVERCCWLQSCDSPAALGEDHGEAGWSPSAHVVPWWSRHTPADCGRLPTRADGDCNPVTGSGFWQDLWTCGDRNPCWSNFAGKTCDPIVDPCWRPLFLGDCTPFLY